MHDFVLSRLGGRRSGKHWERLRVCGKGKTLPGVVRARQSFLGKGAGRKLAINSLFEVERQQAHPQRAPWFPLISHRPMKLICTLCR